MTKRIIASLWHMFSEKQKNIIWAVVYAAFFLFFTIRTFVLNIPDTPQLMIGSFPIQPFGMLVALGILFGVYRTQVWAVHNSLDEKIASDGAFYIIFIALIGSHFLDVLWYYPKEFINANEYRCIYNSAIDCNYIFNFRQSYSSLGGFVTAILVGIFYFRKKGQDVMPFADMSVYGITSAWLFGRLACFSAHDHPGQVTDFFLAVPMRGARRHDLGFEELLFTFVIVTVMVLFTRKKRFTGFVVALVTVLYAPMRFALDFLRVGDATYAGLTPAQWLAMPMFLFGAYLFYINRDEKKMV